jgi:hypothetical protein
MIFATWASSAQTATEARILAASIRQFGGSLSDLPIWLFTPGQDDFGQSFSGLDVTTFGYPLIPTTVDLPDADKAFAAAAAEEAADGQDAVLVWMDPNAIVLNEPVQLALPADKVLACRPVDHLLIGSRFSQPPSHFWRLVYDRCGVDPSTIWPVCTTTDRVVMRPYYNAGLLVIRPERRVLRSWRHNFEAVAGDPSLDGYLGEYLKRVFYFQVVLAGTLLSTLRQDEILELPHIVNYGLHMHTEYPDDLRADRLDDLVSARYESLPGDDGWPDIPTSQPLEQWLCQQFRSYPRN